MWKKIGMLLLSAVFLSACSGVTKEQKEKYALLQDRCNTYLKGLDEGSVVEAISQIDTDHDKIKYIAENPAKKFSKQYALSGKALTGELDRLAGKVERLDKGRVFEEKIKDGTIVKEAQEKLEELADSLKNIDLDELLQDTTRMP